MPICSAIERIRQGMAAGRQGPADRQVLPLATVQDHHIIDSGRQRGLARADPRADPRGDIGRISERPSLGHKKAAALSIFDEHRFDGRATEGTAARPTCRPTISTAGAWPSI